MTPAAEAPERDRTAPLLAGFYFAWASALGSFGPFVASYLEARGYTPRGAALLLAALPLMRVVVTPAWTYAADLFRAVTPVLRVVSLGSLGAFALLTQARGPIALALALALYNAFRAPIGPIADTVLLGWAARTGGSFGRVRAWGSAGFLLTAVAVARVIARRIAGPT